MKFKIIKDEFLEVLGTTLSVVEKKNIMPILANVLLEADEPILKISATDLDVAINVKAQAQVDEPGKITVSAKNLYDIVRESAGKEIVIQTSDNDHLEITSNQSRYKIMGLSAKEFPKIPAEDGRFAKISTETLLKMFDKVCFAMSSDETRHHLNGVLLEKADDTTVVMVATDGHRLALDRNALDLSGMKQEKIIIPRKGVNELRKMIASEKGFEMAVAERNIFVKTEKQSLYIRLIDGNFPDYRRVIPEGNPVKVRIPREGLAGALRRVSLLANDRSKGVALYFCNNSLSVTSSNPEIGEAREEMAINYKGPVLNIGFNARYFMDVLAVITDDDVTIEFKDELSPCLVTCDSAVGFRAVVMPMRM